MVDDVLEVLLGVAAGGVALVLGLALAVALRRRGRDGADHLPGEPDHLPAWSDHPSAADGVGGPQANAGLWTAGPAHPAVLLAQADELATHAELAAGRAERAMAAFEEARHRYAAAERRRAAIEADYDTAQSAYAEALRAVQAGRATPHSDEDLHRAHEVSSAALAAYRRGELTVEELRAVFARASGRDPAQEERERQAERLAAQEGSVRRAYDIALSDVRVASKRLHVAEVAAAATTQEAVDAAVEAQLAADEADRYRRRRR
jgi:hypothetical protein